MNASISKLSKLCITTLLAISFGLSGCQPLTPAEQTVEAQQKTEKANLPTPTPASERKPTPTRPSYLELDVDSLKGMQIVFWHPWTGSLADEVNRLVNEFNQTNVWGFTVQVAAPGSPSALVAQVDRALQEESTRPNLVVSSIDQLHRWQRQANSVISLDAYLLDSEWGMPAEEQKAYFPLLWQQNLVSNRQLGIPALADAHMLAFNLSWASELGFSRPPVTPKEFQDQICAAAKDRALTENDGTGGWITSSDPLVFLSWLQAFGWQDLAKLDSGQAQFNNSRAQEGLAYLRGLFDGGCAWNSRLPDPFDYFANRQALAYSLTLSQAADQQAALQRVESKDNWILLPYPAQAANTEPTYFISGESYGILVASPQEQLASWLFIRWMSNPRNQASLAQAGGTLPASSSAAEQMSAYGRSHPWWQQASDSLSKAQAAPNAASWPYISLVLSDAAWQTWQANITKEQLADILVQIDATLPEMIKLVP